MRLHSFATMLVVCLGVATATVAQPRLVNARLTTATVQGSLERTLDGLAAPSGVTWVGYMVPGNAAGRDACCHTVTGGVVSSGCCGLERGVTVVGRTNTVERTVRLEPSPYVAVYLRFEAGTLSRAAAFGLDCEIDGSGQSVVWLNGVAPAESLAWLGRRASADTGNGRAATEGAVTAIAFHADPAADGLLETLARSSTGRSRGSSAAFWLGAARGAAGYDALLRLLGQVTGDKAREQLVFGLSVSKDSRALGTLFDMARHDASAGTRGQALFWIGQKAGARVADTLTQAVRDDPDTEVKTRAVFALSQLPKDEGIPRLIDIARTNRNPQVRKQAMFWLGQSKDPRALAFFETVLSAR